jgi:hypothetical protein
MKSVVAKVHMLLCVEWSCRLWFMTAVMGMFLVSSDIWLRRRCVGVIDELSILFLNNDGHNGDLNVLKRESVATDTSTSHTVVKDRRPVEGVK